MRTSDLLTMPLAALGRQGVRALLTLLGVVFGAFVLAASLSIGQGVQETIDRETRRVEVARRVDVFTNYDPPASARTAEEVEVEGAMSGARRDRLRRQAAAEQGRSIEAAQPVRITRERLGRLAALPHVERAWPQVSLAGYAVLGERSAYVRVDGARPDDPTLARRIVAGGPFGASDRRGAILDEWLAYRLGAVDEADAAALIGRTLRLEFRRTAVERGLRVFLWKADPPSRDEQDAVEKLARGLPGALEAVGLSAAEAATLRAALEDVDRPADGPGTLVEELPIVGIARAATEQERREAAGRTPLGDVLLPDATAADLVFRQPGDGQTPEGPGGATLMVDDERNVKAVVEAVKALGLDCRSAVEFIERERLIYLMIFGAMTCVAAVALLVSGLGIANTMLMSVLERTREIGIMKAVGADNRHLVAIFLVEGALIGLVGAIAGLLLALAASYPGDAWVRSMVQSNMKIDLEGSIFVFPPALIAAVLGFTALVTTLSAVYPARRAAGIDPVRALRHD